MEVKEKEGKWYIDYKCTGCEEDKKLSFVAKSDAEKIKDGWKDKGLICIDCLSERCVS